MKSLYEENKRNRDGEKDLLRHMFKTIINDAVTQGEKKNLKIYKRRAINWISGKNKTALSFQNVVEMLFKDEVNVEALRNRLLYVIEESNENDIKNITQLLKIDDDTD